MVAVRNVVKIAVIHAVKNVAIVIALMIVEKSAKIRYILSFL